MIYRLIRLTVRIYLLIFHRLRISGQERIPAAGGVLLCANHTSYFDSMLIALCTPRQVRFLITRRFYDHPIFGFFVRSCGAIPIGEQDGHRQALRHAARLLRDGEAVAIFPEGRLSRDGLPGSPRRGAALLAAETGLPVVPITISGAFYAFPKGKLLPRPGKGIVVSVHHPVTAGFRSTDRNRLDELTARVMGRIERRVRSYLRRTGRRDVRR